MRLTKTQHSEIFEKYKAGTSIVNLAKEYDVNVTAVRSLLHRHNLFVRREPTEYARKYPINENYFDQIDCQEKAYFLGILWADGTHNKQGNIIAITLQDQDRSILERLNNLLQPTKPILWYKNKNEKRRDSVRLTIANKKISETMIQWGLVPNKTFKLVFPDFLTPELFRHFLRGYWDGDGSIQPTWAQCNMVGTLALCEGVQSVLKEVLGINSTIRIPNAKIVNPIRRLVISGRNNLRKFLNWLYEGSIIHMDRKYEKYQEVINFVPYANGGTKTLVHPDGTRFTEREKMDRANAIRRGDYTLPPKRSIIDDPSKIPLMF